MHRIVLEESSQYYLEMNNDLARNHPSLKNSIIAGIHLGEAMVYLRDNNVGPEDAVKSPNADLHIVAPSYITIDIDPHSNWNVIVGQNYNLHISVFDSHNHRLFSSANLVAELEIEEGYFEVAKRTENGTWLSGQPLKVGSATVNAVLLGVKDIETGELSALSNPLKATAQLDIFEPIYLEPQLLYFPWDPIQTAVHQVVYAIKGHESTPLSSFVWTSLNKSVATVAQNGVAKTTGALGDTKIAASMNRANHNRGEAQIFVVPVADLEFLKDQVVEVPTGSDLHLPISMWGHGKRMFHQCNQVAVQSALADKTILEPSKEGSVTKSLPQKACTFLSVKGSSIGFSKVTASYTYEMDYEPVKVKDSLTIGVYDPLTPVQPNSGTTVVAVGSSVDIVWSGGPQPWILSPESHVHELIIEDTGILEHVEQKSIPNNYYVYSITCNKAGETKAVLRVGNKASSTLAKPIVEESSVDIVCGDPDKLSLTASPKRPEGPCPMMAKSGRIAALCYDDLRINVSVFDAAGRKFDNYSSLDITWDNSDGTLGELQVEKGTLYLEKTGKTFYRDFMKSEGFQILQTKGLDGVLDITATLRKSSYLMGRTTSDVLELKLVKDAEISPPKLALFNHVDNHADLTVIQGSGYFRIESSELGIASYQYSSSNKTIHLSPLVEGATVVKAVDLCLPQNTNGAKAPVNVIGIQKVELKMVDKVQLNNEFQATVQLWDQFGDLIDISKIKDAHLDIGVTAANKDVALIERHANKKDTFIVKGAVLGHSTLTANAIYGKRRVASHAMPLQVFPPLQLEPKNITLIIGAKFQVQVLGGPGQKDSNIEFSMQHGKIANADGIGLIDALTLGSTILTAKAIGTDRNTGQKLVLSSDKVEVHVVKLHGLKIKSPITKMRVGTEIPLTLLGLDEKNQNSYAFASALPNLNIEWKLNNQEVAKLESPFWRNGLGINDQNNAAMRIVALKPGRIMVKVHATITKAINALGQFQFDRDMEFTDQLEILVFDDLKAKSPHIDKNTLLMGPLSEHQMKTNRDGVAGTKVSYQVLDSSDLITVTRTGKVVSKRNLGTSVILVRVVEDNSVVQELSVTVQVKSVSFLMLNAMPVIKPQKEINAWPLGVKLPLQISYHDESGVRFDAVSDNGMQASTTTRPNRFDTNLLKTEKKNGNESMSIELVQSGYTVLRTMCGTALDDFLVFDVQSGVNPSPHQIGVGDVLLLESVLEGQGKWSAQPNGVVHIDAETGVAMAARTGLARISYHLNSEVHQSLDVEISKASKVVFASREQHLTNQVQNVQSVAFNIISDTSFDGGRRHPNVHFAARNVNLANDLPHAKTLFSCQARFTQAKMDIRNVFKVQPGFLDGSYGCLFTSLDEAPMFSDEIEVTVVPTAGLETLQSQKILVPFSSTVKMISASVISLTNVAPQDEIVLTGLDQVLDSVIVATSESHFMFVGRAYAKDDNTRAWPVGVKSAFWTEVKPGTELNVEVNSPLTGQAFNVPVKVAFRGDQCANIELGWSSLLYFMAAHYQSLLFIVASCVICVFVTRLLSQATTNKPSEQAKPNNAVNAGSPIVNHRIMQNGTPNGTTLVDADARPYLWTVNDSPVYGSPVSASSPYNRKSPRSLTQYSYTER